MFIVSIVSLSCVPVHSVTVANSQLEEVENVNAELNPINDDSSVELVLNATEGGMTGALIDDKMDRQAAELKSELITGKVERIGEGIVVTFDGGLFFDGDDYRLNSYGNSSLRYFAAIVKKYENTNMVVEGHCNISELTDYNLEISVKRANSVLKYLASYGIDSSRLTSIGYGDKQTLDELGNNPGTNDNSRIEIVISANEVMKMKYDNEPDAE